MRGLRRLDPERAVQHLPRLYRAARAWSGSRDEADDLVQETYARVLARPRFLRGRDPLPYLLAALRKVHVNRLRHDGRRPLTVPLSEDRDTAELRSTVDPESAVEAHTVYAAISRLADDYRDVLVAVDIAGLSYREAAKALDIPEGTVMSRLYRARQQVVQRVEGSSAA